MIYLKFILIIFLFLISQKGFSTEIAASMIPSQIKIVHPIWEDTIVHTENRRFCRTINGDCGKVENYSSTQFTMKWDGYAPEVFEKKENKEYFSLKVHVEEIPVPSLPDWSDRQFLIQGHVTSFRLDRVGNMYDKRGQYAGRIVSENMLKKEKDDTYEAVKKNLIIQDPKNNKQVWTQNETGVYELSKIDLKKEPQYRILVFMPSFKRPVFLSGQILRMMHQTYKHFDFYVSIKGVNQEVIEETFVPEWQEYIKSGRLHIRFDSNKKQFPNLLDPIRNADLSKYDYICKIDDDDWYSPFYIENVVDHLTTAKNVALIKTPTVYDMTSSLKSVIFNYNKDGWYGARMCYSKEVVETLFKVEKMNEEEVLKQYELVLPWEWYVRGHEDGIVELIASHIGPTLITDYIVPNAIYNQMYPSISRNINYTEN